MPLLRDSLRRLRGGLPRPRPLLTLLALVGLAGLAWGSIATVLPPSPVAVDAPDDQFSAGRAFAHVERVGARVHVAGSPAAASVRSYIEDSLTDLGLRVEVQEAVGATEAFGGFAMARVHNVVALLPGTDPTGRVFLVAHYDSVQVSFGGNDDGAGVATLLETARALASGPAPRNDVVFVFTDAEEACLCGAEAFVSQHPLAADGGVVLNIEARGSTGPAVMFETSTGNAGVVGVYARHAVHPVGTSFAVEVYRILPNDTDFTPFRESDRFTGLNAAYIDGSAVYHSPEDRPSTMELGSLQQHGDNALALTRAFADADLETLSTPSSGDLTYFPVFGLLLRYPGWLTWPLAGLALAAVIGLALLSRYRRRPYLGAPELGPGLTTWPRILGGIGLGLVPLLLAPVAAQALWALLVTIRPGYAGMLDPWQPGWFRGGVVALVLTVLLGWYGLVRRHLGHWALVLGGLSWLAILGALLAAVTPGGSYLAALPALAVAGSLIVALFVDRPWLGLLAVLLGAAVAVVVLAPTVLLFFPALGLATGGAAALFAMMLGLAVLPVLAYLYPEPPSVPLAEDSALWQTEPSRQRLAIAAPAVLSGVLAVAFVGVGLGVDRFDEEHPVPTQLMYALDTDTGQARWVSAESSPGEWTSRYVTGPEDLSASFPVLGDGLYTGPARVADLPAPELTIVSDTVQAGRRVVELLIEPQRPVRLVYLRVQPAGSEDTSADGVVVLAAMADGRAVPIADGEAGEGDSGPPAFELLFHAPPAGGLTVELTLQSTAPATVRVMDGSDGLDDVPGFTPRPPGIGIEGSHDSELVLVAKTYDL